MVDYTNISTSLCCSLERFSVLVYYEVSFSYLGNFMYNPDAFENIECLMFQSTIKLEALLQRFITSEMVTDVECPGCKKIQAQKLKSLSENMSDNSPPVVIDGNPKTSCLKRLTIGKVI